MKNLISLLSRKLTIQVNNDCMLCVFCRHRVAWPARGKRWRASYDDGWDRQRARRRSYPRSDPSTPGQRPDASWKRCLPWLLSQWNAKIYTSSGKQTVIMVIRATELAKEQKLWLITREQWRIWRNPRILSLLKAFSSCKLNARGTPR